MKFTTIVLALTIASAKESDARRRHLNNAIKGDESDASMSYASVVSPIRGGSSSKSLKSPTGSPTLTPPAPGECGSVINTGDVFTLQKSLQCTCFGVAALTVDGNGTVLNLNGHTVECKPSGGPTIIKVLGTANKILGPGTLTGASSGIVLSEGGFHTVNGVSFGKRAVDRGIEILSNDNTIINNFINEPFQEGVLLEALIGSDGVSISSADRNIIKGNTIIKASVFGLRLSKDRNEGTSNDNHIISNTIISSGLDGIFVRGNRNIILGNTIDHSGQNGIEVDSFTFDGVDGSFPYTSEGTIIKDNSITNSNSIGIAIDSDTTRLSTPSGSSNTVVIGNTLAGNTDNIDNQGSNTIIAGNVPPLM